MPGPWEAYQQAAEPIQSGAEPGPSGPWDAYRGYKPAEAAVQELQSAVGSGFVGSAIRGAGELASGVMRGAAGLAHVLPEPQSEMPIGVQPQPKQEQPPGPGPWEHYFGVAADAIDRGASEFAEQHFPVDPKFKDNLAVKTAQIVGGSAPIVVGALLGGLPGAAGAAFTQAYESRFADAEKAGADAGTAHEAALADGMVNALLMTAPAAQWLRAVAPSIRRPLLNAAADAVVHAGTMIGVTQLQQLAGNVVARETYAPDQSLTAGLGQDMAEQGLAGAIIPGVVGVGRRIADATSSRPTASPELQQAASTVQQAPTQAPPSPQPTPAAPAQPQAQPVPPTPIGMPEQTAMQELERLGGIPPAAEHPAPAPAASDGGLRFRVPDQYAGMIADAAQKHGVPYQVLAWVAQHESSFNPAAVGPQTSSGHARGMFQFMDATAHEFGIDPMDPAQAADGAARYLRQLFDKTGSWEGALHRYGTLSGEGAKLIPDLRRTLADAGIEDRQAGAAGEEREPTTRPIFTNAGSRIDTRPELAELESLITSHDDEGRENPHYPQELQPRDRSSAASQAQIRSGAANLQPERLMPGPDASVGAPIVGPDGTVESGNGRVMMLRQAPEERAAAYRQALEDAGYDTRGFVSPVLISRRLTELDPAKLQQFTREANERSTLGMNAGELARVDAERAGNSISLWQGTGVGSAANRDFVRSFMQQLPPEERGSMMLPDGGLSADGAKRIQAAVMAHAYGSDVGPILDRFLNSDNENMKAIAGAMSDAAGEWARMRDEAARGSIPAAADITPALGEAVQTVARARQLGRPVSEIVNQTDFDRPPISQEGTALLRAMFRDDAMRQPAGRPVVADRLTRYAQEAQKQVAGADMFGTQPPAPAEILQSLTKTARVPEPALFALAPTMPRTGLGAPAPPVRPAPVRGVTPLRGSAPRPSMIRGIADDIQKVFAPTSRLGAKPMEYTIRKHAAEAAQSYERSVHVLEAARQMVARLPRDEQFAITDRMERGLRQPTPELQAVATALRAQLDAWTKQIQSLGRGYLESARDNYMGHIYSNYDAWKAGRVAQAANNLMGQARASGTSKSPIRGSGNFLKQRAFNTQREAMAAGLEPITSNPIDMQLIKLREMQKFYHGTRMADEIKKTGLAQWVPWNAPADAAAAGKVELNDRVFHPYLPPAVATHFMTVDPEIRAGLHAIARHLGVEIKSPLSDATLDRGSAAMGAPALGYQKPGKVVTRFGADDSVLMHEIGHALDEKYGLAGYFGQNGLAWQELSDLARMRDPNQADPKVLAYLQSPTERIANLFHAYWHAPELLQQVAPHAADMLRQYLASDPNLQALVGSVRPSVRHNVRTMEEFFPGLRDMGAWYSPEPVARVFNNYVSPGLAGQSPVYDAIRMSGNALNQMQLGLSGFHATFVTMDTMISKAALGVQQVVQGRVGEGVKNVLAGALPIVTAAQTVSRGSELRRAYLDPQNATPEMRRLVDAFNSGGGRIAMSTFYRANAAGGFIKSLHDLQSTLTDPRFITDQVRQMWGDAPGWQKALVPVKVAGRVIETMTEPLMGYLVPRAKIGVWRDLAEDWMRANPNASPAATAAAMTKFQDSVDNRLGQMVYDNLFWNKTQKDLAFIGVRSVGWNLGTIREIAGGTVDAAQFAADLARGRRPEFTSRMAYVIAMPIIAATYGAALTYLMTGRGPQELKDYFFPPNGKDGRIIVPSYIKDVYEWWHQPLQTAMNKSHPLMSMASQLAQNKDYYGGIIYAPGIDNPVTAYAEYLLNEALPFSVRGAFRQSAEGGSMLDSAMSFWGFQPVPQSISHPEKGEAYRQREMIREMRTRQKERHKQGLSFLGS